MTNKNNIHSIPDKAGDETQVALDIIIRHMPKHASIAKEMRDGFVVAGFTPDEALKLTAYAIFK